MKEANVEKPKEEKTKKKEDSPEEANPILSQFMSKSSLTINEEEENVTKEIMKQIHKSYLYYIKDFLFFFALMISSSMNFSYLYLPLIFIGIIQKFLIGKNDDKKLSLKLKFSYFALIYSIGLLIFKIISIVQINDNNDYYLTNVDIFLDLGICYLRNTDSNFFYIMTFLGEIILIIFSLFSVIIGHVCKKFNKNNDSSLMKSEFWTSRGLIFLNYIFIASFSVFNTSFMTLFYVIVIQIIFFFNSIKYDPKALDKSLKILFYVLMFCIIIQVGLINVFNVPRLQENLLHADETVDKDGNLKVYSIFTKIGINYSYNIKLNYIWKEWCGYLSAILSLITLTFSINTINNKQMSIIIENENLDNQLIIIKKKKTNEINQNNGKFKDVLKFLTSPLLIIQFCRVMAIFYIYLYPNFYSTVIFIPLFLSFLFLDINKNKSLTIYLQCTMVLITILFYHISNINGLFENYSDERRKKYLNLALAKFEYSFLEYYGHHLYYIFIMFLIYSFEEAPKKLSKKINNDDNSNDNELSINDNIEEPLLINKIENHNDNNDDNIIQIIPEEQNNNNNIKDKKDKLTILNLLLKYIFIHIDKITLIAMYFVSMRSINLIHFVLVIIFLIQILLPSKIHKMFFAIICILHALFFIELIIHLLKAYCFDSFNEYKDTMNFILTYTDKILDNDMELSIFIVIYCFYFQYQLDNFPYIKNIINSKEITIEKYVDEKLAVYPKTQFFCQSIVDIISNIYIWILIGVFFVFSCYFEVNFIFALKLAYFFNLSFMVLRRVQNRENGKRFIPIIHYIFLIFCSIHSFLVYIYQFRADAFIKSKIDDSSSSNNFIIKNFPNIGFSIYQKDNLYFNFLPHFGLVFISVLFIDEIQRQFRIKQKEDSINNKIMEDLKIKKAEIEKQLKNKDLINEDIELLKAEIFLENEKALKQLSRRYIWINILKIITKFYWLFLFLSIGIIFSLYDLSFSMVIYLIIFGVIFILIFYRRITKLTNYISRSSYFVSKVIRYTHVEKPISNRINEYYRRIAFKYLLAYNFIFIILLYLYGVFALFQHGCDDSFFKGCEKSNDPFFTPDGDEENYIKSYAFLFGLYVDIRKQGVIEVAWLHILLSLLIGFDIYCQKLEKKYTKENVNLRENILVISNENNTLYKYRIRRDLNVGIRIGLKLAGVPSSDIVLKRLKEEYLKEKEEKRQKKLKGRQGKKNIEEIKKEEIEEKKKEDEADKKIVEINTKDKNEEIINIKEDNEPILIDIPDNEPGNEFLKNKLVKKFLNLFNEVENNKQKLSDTNNNSTKVIWFVKKMFEELIIVLLICVALTKLNVLSFIYAIYFIFLTMTKKTMKKFYILYCFLIVLMILQSIIYVTNISEDTIPNLNSEILTVLEEKLNIPWYKKRLNIENKYAFFFGFGVNKIQMRLLLLEYILVILEYIYFDFFSFSIYQDVLNKGEEKGKFKFGKDKLDEYKKNNAREMDNNLFIQYRECLKNFNVNIGENLNEMLEKLFTEKDKPQINLELKISRSTLETLIYIKEEAKATETLDDKVPDSEFTKSVQEFIYLYLHIFFLFLIILIAIMITGIFSMFYLLISFFYIINSHKIYLGLKYGYPKHIKNLIKICLLIDICIQLIYQIPYISTDKDSTLYKIFNALGFSKLLNYLNNSKVEIASTGIIEIIGKPLIYLIISLQTIIYNSTDFKRYYIIFLLNLKNQMTEVGYVNSYIFNNSRINEFNKSVDLRLNNEKKMEKVKEKVTELSKKIEGVDIFEGPIQAPLKYFKEQAKEREEKKKLKEEKEKEIKEKEGKKIDLTEEIKEKKSGEIEEKDKENELIDKIKEKGAFPLIEEISKTAKKKRAIIIKPEKIKEKIKSILLSGCLMKIYMWFSRHSTSSFKSMDSDNKNNFKIDCFRDIETKCFIENEIDEMITILDLSNFNHKEVNIIEDFCKKFKAEKLDEEINRIKNEINNAKLKKIQDKKEKNKNNEINTNINNDIDNNTNIIDEKELENIDIEYNIKRGGTDININTIKFKQFLYLLQANVFRFNFKKLYLYKTIFSILGSFLSSNFDYLIYLLMIITHMYNSSILSLFYPLSVFCYALLENPRPKKSYWQTCLYYTIIVLILKFVFQLKLLPSIMEEEKYKEFVDTLYHYKIGIRYFDEGFGIEFFGYIILDSLLLLVLCINKNILIGNGLWDKREEQIESIYLANERVMKFKDINTSIIINYLRLLFCEMYYTMLMGLIDNKRDKYKKELKLKSLKDKEKKGTKELKGEVKIKEKEDKEKKEEEKKEENKEEKKEEEKKKEEKKEENKEEQKEEEKKEEESYDDDGPINNDDLTAIVSLYNLQMLKDLKYDESDKGYFRKLFPRMRNEKPGTDKYPFLAVTLILIIIYILICFTLMVQDKNYGPVNLDTTQLSGGMVLFLILHIFIFVFDRIIYVSQNKSDLKFKYFIYKNNEKNIGKPISKREYNNIKRNYGYEDDKKPFHFSPSLINTLKEKNYNIFYIQTEEFNKPLLQKYLLHIFTTLICHGFAFFYFPMKGNYNTCNSVYCIDENSDSCNDFKKNGFVIFFYILYMFYLYFSSVQIRLGYYDIKRKSLFKRNTTITNLMSTAFNAIPFLPQIRHVIDWTYTNTCFDLKQWIKFESIYNSIFGAYTEVDENDDAPIGKKMEIKKQKGIGNSLAFILVLILVVPLILYSSLNPTNKLNNLKGGKLSVDLSFIYENDIELKYNLFENSRIQSINDMFKSGDSVWVKNKYDQSAQTKNFEHAQIQIIKFSETSDRNWDLARPHINNLIEMLNITNNVDLKSINLKILVEFERDLPAEAQTVSHDFNITIYNLSMNPNTSDGAIKISNLSNALKNCENVSIDLEEGYSSPLRFTSGVEVTEIEDEKYFSKKQIQLGFQGCERQELIIYNETKKINSYLRSYFTFKSKDPEDADFSEVEFHAFNDVISETLAGYSIISFYVTFILVAGQYVANYLSSEPEKIMYTDLPHPELIVELCEGIIISRYNHDFKEEESLYTILIELMRSPDYLKKLTQSSIANLEIRKINNVEHDEDEDIEDKDSEKEEDKNDNDDDENDNYYVEDGDKDDKKEENNNKENNAYLEEEKEEKKEEEKEENNDIENEK